MAFADLGSLGATGSTGNNQSSLTLTTTANIAAGSLVVVAVADDNRLNNTDDNATASVTLAGFAMTRMNASSNLLAAQAGTSISIWRRVAPIAIASGASIIATFTDATLSDATAMVARHFSKAAGAVVSSAGSATSRHDTAADPASLDVATVNIECIRIRAIASQVGNNTNLTPTASWTAWANGNSATTGTTGEICCRVEHLISTDIGAASNPTYVSAICATTYDTLSERVSTKVKHSGTWKPAETFVKHAGAWQIPTAFVRHSGTWKQV